MNFIEIHELLIPDGSKINIDKSPRKQYEEIYGEIGEKMQTSFRWEAGMEASSQEKIDPAKFTQKGRTGEGPDYKYFSQLRGREITEQAKTGGASMPAPKTPPPDATYQDIIDYAMSPAYKNYGILDSDTFGFPWASLGIKVSIPSYILARHLDSLVHLDNKTKPTKEWAEQYGMQPVWRFQDAEIPDAVVALLGKYGDAEDFIDRIEKSGALKKKSGELYVRAEKWKSILKDPDAILDSEAIHNDILNDAAVQRLENKMSGKMLWGDEKGFETLWENGEWKI